jgi:glyoxylase-like metal-dependent hydrolase (beta-lactamase superfamily II)
LAERVDGRPIDPAALSTARSALVTGDATLADVTESLDLRLRPDLLAPISHWTTPPVMPRRFDTRFFVAELPHGVEPTFTTGEVQAHRWLTAAAALHAMAAGEIGLWPPTSATLQQLEHVSSYADVVERLATGRLGEPRTISEGDDVVRVVLGGAGGVPGQTVNCYLVGRREIVVVDPGDPSDEAAEAILAAVARRGGRVAGIAVTHVDPDHAAGAEPLALRLGLRVVVGKGGGRVLSSDVDEVGDGERFATGDVDLTALATPGPRADHVAYLVGSSRDVLAGDLVGGRASRSVLGPADGPAWRRSLDRLRDLGPQRLFPGHGEPLGADALSAARLSAAGTPPGSAGS